MEIVISLFSILIIIAVTVVILYQNAQLKDSIFASMQSVVDQVNDSTLYAYRFDKNQDTNIKNIDSNMRMVHEHLDTVTNNVRVLKSQVDNTMQNTDVVITKQVKTNMVSLGGHQTLVGRDDGWMYVNSAPHGGVAAANLFASQSAYLGSTDTGSLNTQELTVKGGKSEHNPENMPTHFNYSDGMNYIRGDTEIRGNTTNIGDLNVRRALRVAGGANGASRLSVSASGAPNAWFSEIQAENTQGGARVVPNALIINPRGGSVGIGSVDPRYAPKARLHVVGDVRVEDKICIGNTCINEAQFAKIKQVTGS